MKPSESGSRALVACAKCGQNIIWPEKLTAAEKRNIAFISRRNRAEAAIFAHATLALDLHAAKALAYHISAEKGRCHRCGSSVVKELSVCAKCRSANLDW